MNQQGLQALMDGMSAQWMKERAASQMTLGRLIERLEGMSSDIKIELSEAHSYRGYYSDLSFEPGSSATVGELLNECKGAMGECFQGWKGGDFHMHAGVPVWVAYMGRGGKKLIAINDDGTLELADDE